MRIFFLGLLYGWYACYTIDAFREKMKNGKAVGQEWIPAEAWKALGEQEIDTCYTIDAFREKMKNDKAVGQEWIPAEAWRALGEK